MYRSELQKHMFDMTKTEKHRLESKTSIPSKFYIYLESMGRKNEKGIYHLPASNFVMPGTKPDGSIWSLLDSSIHQQLFRLKKASRFFKEPLAYADFIALRYVYSGKSILITPNDSITLKTNDLCLMNRGFIFSQHLPNEEDIVFTLMFEKEFLLRNITNRLKADGVIAKFIIDYIMENKNPQNYILFHGQDNERIPQIFEDMVCEYLDPTPFGETLLESYLQILFIEMLGSDFEYSNRSDISTSAKILDILKYIDEHYLEVSLDTIANEFGYNSKYVSRLIKDSTGKNFKDYILDKRLEMVCTFLTNSSMPIHEIMLNCGFSNETYFYKKFKEYYNMSPNEYRRAH